jgi:probable phosphoglycerate mutase
VTGSFYANICPVPTTVPVSGLSVSRWDSPHLGEDDEEIFLVRHGETADNAQGRILGHRDPPLSAAGIAQAEALAETLREQPPAAIWTSPLRRAEQTAVILGAALDLHPRVLTGLEESDRGRWEGREAKLIAAEEPQLFEAFLAAEPGFVFPGGESIAAQIERSIAALREIAAGPLPALAVAHAGTIRATLAAAGEAVPPEASFPHGRLAVRARLDAR